ncbi:beta/gamma crystallin-related protein [uncultured Brevundimonas sp.]|uniref:beta/gamma crystallin-related protein n=1 Tax=uncultured Brevundimonas sp. TaxID=213418 RepID=UPI0030EB458C|tara:strand:+ start:178 stop:795 length:618 start_codon:yes stop_codon:yes gene_type:complete
MLISSFAALAAMVTVPQQAAPHNDQEPQRVSPRGSYSRSCSGDYVNQGRLYADCRDRRGNVRGTSIELNRCSSRDISNDDGLLVCGPVRGEYEDRRGDGRGGRGDRWNDRDNGGGWGRGGRSSITVYRDADFRGASYSFNGEIVNLGNTEFNDVISSMRFRGEWEVCTDAYFRGQCQTFSDDVRNLDRWGMNDRISSLRPVRRGR